MERKRPGDCPLLHTCHPEKFPTSGIPEAWFHWFNFKPYLDELTDLMNRYGPWLQASTTAGERLYWRLTRLVEACKQYFQNIELDPGRESVRVSLCHVDQNLANAICGSDGRVRWVDGEFSGWGDPALDLAEIRWHAAFEDIDDTQHPWLRSNYQRSEKDRNFHARLTVWEHLLATRCPLLILRWLWSNQNGPDRMRLSHMQVTPAVQSARLERYITRAEMLYRDDLT